MPTILIADDSSDARRPLVRLLQREGYVVLTACNAMEAMATAQRSKPDLILLDVSMPPIDGLTLLSRLRDAIGGNDVPVIVVTGLKDDLTQRRAVELGVKQYFVKADFQPDELLDSIKKHLPN
jgi:CheY-like chemotaxis protein